MKFRVFYRLLVENPEYALGGNRDEQMTFQDADAVCFGLRGDGKLDIGDSEDVPDDWKYRNDMGNTMTHARLYALRVVEDDDPEHDPHNIDAWKQPWGKYNAHKYYKVLGRSWCRKGVLYISFWRNGTSDEKTMKYIIRELRKWIPDGKNVKVVKYQNDDNLSHDEWENFGDEANSSVREKSAEEKNLSELERLLHTADPGQKPFIRRGIEILRKKMMMGESVIRVDEHGKNIVWENDSVFISVDDPNDVGYIVLWDKNKKSRDLRVGTMYLTSGREHDTHDYKIVASINIVPKWRGKGYGRIMYKMALKYLGTKFKGIGSESPDRANNKQVPKIWKSLGARETESGAFLVDRTISESTTKPSGDIRVKQTAPNVFRAYKGRNYAGALIVDNYSKPLSVYKVEVKAEYRKMGVGRALYDAAQEVYRKLEPSNATSDDAHGFWSKYRKGSMDNDLRTYKEYLLGQHVSNKHHSGIVKEVGSGIVTFLIDGKKEGEVNSIGSTKNIGHLLPDGCPLKAKFSLETQV